MPKIKKIALVLIMMILVCMLLNSCAQQPFRFHVIANSNNLLDQQIKLKVRDAVLEATGSDIQSCSNAAQAEEYIKSNMQTILSTANNTLEEQKAGYSAKAYVGEFHFPEKTYGDITYGEGDYQALRIVLGQGKGQNWWCVMFPPLCLSEIYALDENGEQSEDLEYKSFLAELFASWRK